MFKKAYALVAFLAACIVKAHKNSFSGRELAEAQKVIDTIGPQISEELTE